MNLVFVDDKRMQLLPLTYTRPTAELRIGILTIREKWEKRLGTTGSFLTEAYLQSKFPLIAADENLYVNGRVVPNDSIINAVNNLQKGEVLYQEDTWVAARLADFKALDQSTKVQSQTACIVVNFVWDIFKNNGQAIQEDFDFLTAGRTSQPLSATNRVAGAENIFLEEGASVEFSILNATTGPIYVGKNAQIMEGCVVRGGLAMVENSVLKMGAKIYGPTTLGTYCKVGGEVNNAVLTAYSNKGHEGFLGNAVLGEWCNLGADTNNSNLKNNYAPVKVWNYETGRFTNTGLQFCGLLMGDHSKSGINTMFNTGTVIGVSSNIYGGGFPRTFIPSFAWGGASGYMTYRIDKALETAERMMGRRKVELTEADVHIMKHIMESTAQYRKWEKN